MHAPASITRCRVCSLISGLLRNARDTVDFDMFSFRAISLMVTVILAIRYLAFILEKYKLFGRIP